MRLSRMWIPLFCSGTLTFLACSPGERLDSKTNWFLTCKSDVDCGDEFSCECGACTATCKSLQDCEGDSVACAESDTPAFQLQCSAKVELGFCAPQCDSSPDCAAGEECTEGVCTKVPEVPADACARVADFPEESRTLENEMLLTLNEARSSGTLPCDSGLRTRLVFDERLRCAARLHVLEMEDLDYHLVTSPDGITPGDRAESAGYPVNIWGGSISQAAFDSPQEFIAAVAEQYSTGGDTTNCTNIVDIDYKHVGVGYADGYFSIIYASGE